MQDTSNQTVLFLFGCRPAEPAILQAHVLIRHLPRCGWNVQVAALAAPAARMLSERFSQPVHALSSRLAGVPILGRLLAGGLPGEPQVVHAWDFEAARFARLAGGRGGRLCLSAADSDCRALPPRHVRGLRSADCVTCYSEACSRKLSQTGVDAGRVRVIGVAVDGDLLGADAQGEPGDSRGSAQRQAVLAGLGVDARTGPIVAVPPPVERGSGHFELAWGVFILRRAGLSAQLLLPHPGRESKRIQRFAAACHEQAGIVICPAGTSYLDLLGAADVVVIPDRARSEPVLAAWALACGRPVVVRSSAPGDDESAAPPAGSLVSPQTCLFTPDARPLSLARVVLRAWQEREIATELIQAGNEQARRQCDPATIAAAVAQLYT